MENQKPSKYAQKAMTLFQEGYNCAQAVFLAFADQYAIDEKTALALASSFGGGMGRMREVCGAVSGMFLVAGIRYGYTSPKDQKKKAAHYERIQQLANEFRKQNHSIICRELLGLEKNQIDQPTPQMRTAQYYQKRPCKELVGMAAAIMESYLQQEGHVQ